MKSGEERKTLQAKATPSIRTIAEASGTAPTTVSLALRDSSKVALSTRLRIKELADRLGYRPSPLIRQAMFEVRQRRSEGAVATVAWVAAIDQDPWTLLQMEGAKEALEKLGYNLRPFHFDPFNIGGLEKAFRDDGIVGALLCGCGHSFSCLGERLFSEEIAVVALDENLDPSVGIPSVGLGLESAARRCVHEAYEAGYRRLGLALEEHYDERGRFRTSFRDAVKAYHLDRDIPTLLGGGEHPSLIRKWIKQHHPDCVVSDSATVVQELRLASYRIPDEIGYIHVRPFELDVFDSVAHIDSQEIAKGRLAVQVLIGLIEHGRVGTSSLPVRNILEPGWVPGATLREVAEDERRLPGPTFQSHTTRTVILPLEGKARQPVSGQGGWFGRFPLRFLPPGTRRFAGVPMRVAEEQGRALAVMLSHPDGVEGLNGRFPDNFYLTLPKQCRGLYILHAASGVKAKEPFAQYEMGGPGVKSIGMKLVAPAFDHYDESEEDLFNINDWWRTCPPVENSHTRPVVLTAYGDPHAYRAHLHVFRWLPEDPGPYSWLRASQIPNARGRLAILAISAILE